MVATASNIKKLKNLKYQQEINLGRGLRAKANRDGSASWFFRMKMQGLTTPVYMKLGTWPDITIDEAEDKARIYRTKIAENIHPRDYEAEQAKIKTQMELEALANAITLEGLLADYERSIELFGKNQSPSTMRDRRNGVRNVFAEWLDKPISAITKEVVLNKIYEWESQRGSRGQVLKVCDYMSAMFNFAKTMDRIASNPFDIRKGRISRRSKQVHHWLNIAECKTLFSWLEKLQRPEKHTSLIKDTFGLGEYEATVKVQRQLQYDAIALTLLTGLRKLEVLSLRWDQVYLSRENWGNTKGPYFEFIKSKQQEPMGVPISPQMIPFFERCLARRDMSPFVFPSVRTNKSITNTRKGFAQINMCMPKLENAPEIMPQVLRKTFATTAYSLGYSFEQIGLFTGHTSAISNTKVATSAYVARQADSHREGFETINSALVGDIEVQLEPMPSKMKDLGSQYGNLQMEIKLLEGQITETTDQTESQILLQSLTHHQQRLTQLKEQLKHEGA